MRLARAAAENLARDPRVRYVEEDGIVEVSQESIPWDWTASTSGRFL